MFARDYGLLSLTRNIFRVSQKKKEEGTREGLECDRLWSSSSLFKREKGAREGLECGRLMETDGFAFLDAMAGGEDGNGSAADIFNALCALPMTVVKADAESSTR